MTSTLEIHPDVEILPGYRLIRKIGSGGYGEVWLCDAPGGLKKAVKIVYGTLDEERAASEMRSLQRIREVKHPFILSLERIEVIDGHLMIVTELAESSLYDQFQAYCLQGMNGIPRDRLIGYLRDTAEALDFLSLKHDLQHLDVKPGNLLLVADRVKLADFGVVKSLSEKQHSCIGGLTPSYAAPEMFDGRAGRHSDQYSLAIMYYELLTGRLPFDGSSMAQLATQHLHHKPNVELIPDAEQAILHRALSKDPSQRFSKLQRIH
jgi:serine/threonine protein kinase